MNSMPNRVSAQQMSSRMKRIGKMNTESTSVLQNSEMVDPFMLIFMNMMSQDGQLSGEVSGMFGQGAEGQNAAISALSGQGIDLSQMGLDAPELNALMQSALEEAGNTQTNGQGINPEQSAMLQNAYENIAKNLTTGENAEKNLQMLGMYAEQLDAEAVTGNKPDAMNNTFMANAEDPMSVLRGFAENTEKVKAMLGGEAPNLKLDEQEIDVDAFMQEISSEKSMTPFEMQLERLKPTSEMPVLEQMKVGIKQNVDAGNSEFTIKLKPEALGEITVKIVEEAGKTTLSITAANSETVKLINDDLISLKEAVAPMGVKVEEAVMTVAQSAASEMRQFDMAGRQFEAQQYVPQSNNGQTSEAQQEFAGGQFADRQFAEQQFASEQGKFQGYRAGTREIDSIETEAIPENLTAKYAVKPSGLDYYI